MLSRIIGVGEKFNKNLYFGKIYCYATIGLNTLSWEFNKFVLVNVVKSPAS
jgi:hypothetical protein